MLYAIISEDVANSLPLRKQARADHLARLESLKEQGRLILAGPHPAIDSNDPGDAGFTGSLVVAEFPSLDVESLFTRPPRLATVFGSPEKCSLDVSLHAGNRSETERHCQQVATFELCDEWLVVVGDSQRSADGRDLRSGQSLRLEDRDSFAGAGSGGTGDRRTRQERGDQNCGGSE